MNRKVNLIHTLCVVGLLLLFGASIYTLTAAGGSGYGRMAQKQEEAQELRVAANYLTTQLRRFDRAGGVAVVYGTPLGECLVLTEELDGYAYETRVYWYDGLLCESFVSADTPYDADYGFEIAALDGFELAVERGLLTARLAHGGETRTVSVYLTARGTV